MTISSSITRAFSRGLVQTQKHSPVLLTAAGIVGLIGAGVLAAKATLKLEETIDEAEGRLVRAKNVVEQGAEDPTLITKTLIYNAIQIGKLYWIPATIAVGSTILILSGHRILNKRNAALAVAYQGLQTAFNNYRQRVVEQYGEQVDQDFRLGLRNETIEDENGKKKKVQTLDRAETEAYIFSFGPENDNWVPNHEHNLFFLTGHQNIFNDLLRARGHLFLSEVLDGLGIPRTPVSIVTGWLYKPEDKTRDNFVDFGIKDLWDSQGYILLDINVDGTIFDQI